MPNRPTPSSLRQLSGSHPERLNKREARFTKIEALEAPDWLDDLAKEEFHRAGPELIANGTLTKAGFQMFCAYCASVSLMIQAQKDIAVRGMWVEEEVYSKAGELVGTKSRPNPMLVEANRAMIAALRIADAFGLTPSSSSKVQAEPGANQKRPSFADFMVKPEPEDGNRSN